MQASHWNSDDFSEAMGRVMGILDGIVDDDTGRFVSIDPDKDVIVARSALATAGMILGSIRGVESDEFVEVADSCFEAADQHISALEVKLAVDRDVEAAGMEFVDTYLLLLDEVIGRLDEFNSRVGYGMMFDEARARVKEMKPSVKIIKKQWSLVEPLLTSRGDVKIVKRRVKFVKKTFTLCEEYRDFVRM
mgnify:CR=1 FL=1